MKIVQLNLNHCETAQDLLNQYVRETEVDVAIICEQYRELDESSWETDDTGRAAIWACGNVALQEKMMTREEGFVRAKVAGIHVYSCYASPNAPIEQFERQLDRLLQDATGRKPVIIAGDFNAWAVEWGSQRTNQRGRVLLEAFAHLDLVLVNQGSAYTFRRGDTGSIVDLTFASSCLIGSIDTWTVSEHYTNSDHQAIIMEIRKSDQGPDASTRTNRVGWKTKDYDKEMFLLALEELQPSGTANSKAEQVMENITRACDAAMPRRVTNHRRPPVYWWDKEVESARSECHRTRRREQRARIKYYRTGRGQDTVVARGQEMKDAKRSLKKTIRENKRRCLKELQNEVEQDPWGRPYKIVMKKIKGSYAPPPKCPELLNRVVTTLFPRQLEEPCVIGGGGNVETIPPITNEELLSACARVGNNKAPGLDGIPNIALKHAIHAHPEVFVDLYNSCLEEGTFPTNWKKQRLVLLPKGKKPPQESSSYRPLCMLDTPGKILERIICVRMDHFIEGKGGLAEHQYGFRKNRSTLDAVSLVIDTARTAIDGKRWKGGKKEYCAIVTLDVKNAFNSAKWSKIHEALRKQDVPVYIRRMMSDYLKDRILLYDTESGTKTYEVTGGVPQGSVLGPPIWNIMYDGVLRLQLPTGATVVGFADDIAVVVVAKHKEEVTEIAEEAIRIIHEWLTEASLELASHKTEVILISSRKKMEEITLTVDGHEIASQPTIKYLGITIDERLKFKQHLETVSDKAAKVGAALSRLMPNVGGPTQKRRLLLASVTTSIMLYGAPIWADAMLVQSYARKLTTVYRRSALRVASAYRTVSDDAVCIIAGMPPIDLLAVERKKVFDARRRTIDKSQKEIWDAARKKTITDWQTRWDVSDKGRWTHRLIPKIEHWIERRHGEVHYYLTQFLTGHGCFRAYLHRFKLEDSPNCPVCSDAMEDAEHVFCECSRYQQEREDLESYLQIRVTPESIMTAMLASEDGWCAVSNYAADILKKVRKDEEERRRRRG